MSLLKWYKHLTVIQKFLICLITNKGIIFLIVGSGNFGPVPTPLQFVACGDGN